MAKGHSKTSVRKIEAREKAGKALEMRLSGATFDDIAATIGFTNRSVAYKAVTAAMDRLGRPDSAEKLRELELARLDKLLTTMWGQAINAGDQFAVDRVLKIMERRSKYMGLDAPEKHMLGELPLINQQSSLEGLPFADDDGTEKPTA